MNYLTRICSDRAAHLIADNRPLEAIGPLLAARRFGGGLGVEQNATFLAWRLLEAARAALLEERMRAATRNASFALILAESPQALFILANAALTDDPAIAFGLAARMETLSPRGDAGLRAAALRLMTTAWLRTPAPAEAYGAILAARLAHCLAEHPADAELTALEAALADRLPPISPAVGGDDLAIDYRAARHIADLSALDAPEQTLEALGCVAAAVTLTGDAAWLAGQRARLGHRLLSRYFDVAHEGEAAVIEALALLCAFAPRADAMDQLLAHLIQQEEWEATLGIGGAQLKLAAPTTVEWHRAAQYVDLADSRIKGIEPAEAQASARGAAMARLTAALDARPELHELRNLRAELRLASRQFSLALDDLRTIAARALEGAALPPAIAQAAALNLLLLLPGGKRPETTWAAQELIRDPPADPGAQQTLLLRLWEAGATTEGRVLAARLAQTLPQYHLYADLERFIEDLDRPPAAQFGRQPNGRAKVYASMVCWGRSYLEMLEMIALASLASPGNIPTLAQSADILFELLVGPDDVAQVIAMPILRDLAEHCEIRVTTLPFPDGDASLAKRLPYVVYGHGSHFTLLRARRDGADLLNLHPDIVYADGAIGALAPLTQDPLTQDRLTKGPPRVFFADGVNAAKTPVMAALEDFRRDGRLTVDARRLATLAEPHWMPRLTDCLYDPEAQAVIHYPHRLVFLEADRMVMHSFCKLPIYVANQILRDIQSFDYATVDGYLSDSILDNIRRDQIVEVTDADPILFVELNDEDGVRYSKVAAPLPQVIADMFYIFPFSARRYWLFETGVHYPPGTIGRLVASQDRLHFLADTRRDLLATPQFTELDQERDQIRPEAARGPAILA